MSVPDKKDSLKNKFNSAEIAVDPDMKFRMSEDSLKALAKERVEKQKSPFFWLNVVGRSLKILFKITKDFSSFVFSDLIKPSSKASMKWLASTYQSLKKGKEKKEIQIGEYLQEVESKINFKEAKIKIKELETTNVFQAYENKIKRSFDEGLCNVTVNADKNDFAKSSKSLAFDADIFEFVATKLRESQLVSNIDYMTVTSTVEKLEMVHMLEFELKVAGQSWASIFSKFISSEIYKKIEWAGGKIDGHHMNNVTLIRDTFVLIFSHQRLEVIEASQDMKRHEEKSNAEFDLDLKSHKQERTQDI